MFNFIKSDKDKKLEVIRKQFFRWYQVCVLGVDQNLLKEPRPMVGAILFFLGSVDSLCKANAIDDETSAEFEIEILNTIGCEFKNSKPLFSAQ